MLAHLFAHKPLLFAVATIAAIVLWLPITVNATVIGDCWYEAGHTGCQGSSVAIDGKFHDDSPTSHTCYSFKPRDLEPVKSVCSDASCTQCQTKNSASCLSLSNGAPIRCVTF